MLSLKFKLPITNGKCVLCDKNIDKDDPQEIFIVYKKTNRVYVCQSCVGSMFVAMTNDGLPDDKQL